MKKPKITVVGSLNMDMVLHCDQLPKAGQTVLAKQTQQVSGGKGANQAVAAAKAGGNVKMLGCVGDDVFGGQLIDNLNSARNRIVKRSGCSRLCEWYRHCYRG